MQSQNILFVNSSPRGDYSESKAIGQAIVDKLVQKNPDANVDFLDLTVDSPPIVTLDWVMGAYTDPAGHTESQKAAVATSDIYIDQLFAADTIVLAVPMFNFGVPGVFKLWIDQICRIGRTFTASYEGLAKNKKVYVVSARGGAGYGPGQAMESADFVIPYLRAVLGFIGMTDVTFYDIENTATANENFHITKGRAQAAIEAL